MRPQPAVASVQEILEPLTPAQRQAVTHVDGPLLILAGPGSGKTRVITHRVAYLLTQGIPAWQILALTFTNKAADEMKLRLERLAPGQQVWMGTFHRFCARLLRQHADLVGLRENYSIFDMDDARVLFKEAIDEAGVALSMSTPEQIYREVSTAKNNLILPDQYTPRAGHGLGSLAASVYPHYQRRLLESNGVDFDDLLLHVATLLRENGELRESLDARYRYILVDEYQDTNFAQYAIVRALSQQYPNLAVTGDPDQSIYGWRGADLNNILDFERDFPRVTVVRLEQNYRSTPDILRAAGQLIRNNRLRKDKELFTDRPGGDPVRVMIYPTCRDEAEHIAEQIADEVRRNGRRPRDFAIFYRANNLSRLIEHALRAAAIPYQVVRGLEFYQRKEIKDILAYLHLINNPQNDVAFLRVINTPPRQIGKKTVQRLAEHARRYRVSLLEAARESGLIESITKRAASHVAAFVALQDKLSLLSTAPMEEIMGQVLELSGYSEWLSASQAVEDEERLANIQELLSDAREFDRQHPEGAPLEAFLEQTSLVSDVDEFEMETDRVSLMTLHAAKGLEFPVVFIVAVEENILPHHRSKGDDAGIEEERRLLFVGMTRAEERLQLSASVRRMTQGTMRYAVASQFLLELPQEEIELIKPPGMQGMGLIRRSGDPADWDEFGQEEFGEDWDQSVDDGLAANAVTSGGTVRPAGSPPPSAPRVVTAAEMAGQTPSPGNVSPEVFRQGMIIQHPEHGLGKIIALSGEGKRRSAKVQFFSSPRVRSYMLAQSELRPVGG